MPFGQNSNLDGNGIRVADEAASEKPQAIRILHAEDNLTLAGLVREIGEHESWKVEHCIDGDAALEQLVGHMQYDLLLVDFELPGLNGLELIG